MPAHVKCAMLGSTLTIPITNGQFNLGTWQGTHCAVPSTFAAEAVFYRNLSLRTSKSRVGKNSRGKSRRQYRMSSQLVLRCCSVFRSPYKARLIHRMNGKMTRRSCKVVSDPVRRVRSCAVPAYVLTYQSGGLVAIVGQLH